MKQLILMTLLVLMGMTTMAQEKTNKKNKKVEEIYPVYLDVCELNEQQELELYDLLMERQKEISKCKKEYKVLGEKPTEALVIIKTNYLEKIEKLIGKANMKKMEDYKSSQMRFDIKSLEE